MEGWACTDERTGFHLKDEACWKMVNPGHTEGLFWPLSFFNFLPNSLVYFELIIIDNLIF